MVFSASGNPRLVNWVTAARTASEAIFPEFSVRLGGFRPRDRVAWPVRVAWPAALSSHVRYVHAHAKPWAVPPGIRRSPSSTPGVRIRIAPGTAGIHREVAAVHR